MNSHLNVFKTYAKENRVYQLENDLTRAFAISMQEDALFFYEIIRVLLDNEQQFELLFSNSEIENSININIQVNSKDITNYEKIIAVSLSEFEMGSEYFWQQSHHKEYDTICDIVIQLNDTLIIIEAKRDAVDCVSQLYNQVFNITRNTSSIESLKEFVEPRDLNWRKLMKIVSKVLSFQNTVTTMNRFTLDFLNLVKGHNPNWFPETPIAGLSIEHRSAVYRRIESAINHLDIVNDYKKLKYNDRLGLAFSKPWAQEILFHVTEESDLMITVYAGNTKAQGWHIFSQDLHIKEQLVVDKNVYELNQRYHIKLTSFQSYFTGLWCTDQSFTKPGLYSKNTYYTYSGRNSKSKGHWANIENLFDEYFTDEYNWRRELQWKDKVLNTNRSQFDLSFGYELHIIIPFSELKKRDTSSTNLDGLLSLIRASYNAFENVLIKL